MICHLTQEIKIWSPAVALCFFSCVLWKDRSILETSNFFFFNFSFVKSDSFAKLQLDFKSCAEACYLIVCSGPLVGLTSYRRKSGSQKLHLYQGVLPSVFLKRSVLTYKGVLQNVLWWASQVAGTWSALTSCLKGARTLLWQCWGCFRGSCEWLFNKGQ